MKDLVSSGVHASIAVGSKQRSEIQDNIGDGAYVAPSVPVPERGGNSNSRRKPIFSRSYSGVNMHDRTEIEAGMRTGEGTISRGDTASSLPHDCFVCKKRPQQETILIEVTCMHTFINSLSLSLDSFSRLQIYDDENWIKKCAELTLSVSDRLQRLYICASVGMFSEIIYFIMLKLFSCDSIFAYFWKDGVWRDSIDQRYAVSQCYTAVRQR